MLAMGSLKFKQWLVVILVLLSASALCFAQKNVEHQNLVWTRYALKLKIDDHWSASQDFEERTYWFPWRQHQFVSRSMGRYSFDNGLGIGVGMAYFLQALPQDPDVEEFTNQPELRPEFEISYQQRLSDQFAVNHRYWAEWRYFKLEHKDYAFGNYRFRYKLEVQFRVRPKVIIRAFDEIFINAGKNIVNNTFDQNRIGASIQYMPFKNFGFELGYFNWYQQRESGTDFYNRNIMRLTIHHHVNFQDQKSVKSEQ